MVLSSMAVLKKYKKSTVHAIDTQQSLKALEMTILVLFLI